MYNKATALSNSNHCLFRGEDNKRTFFLEKKERNYTYGLVGFEKSKTNNYYEKFNDTKGIIRTC
jgi:hypothetical protein